MTTAGGLRHQVIVQQYAAGTFDTWTCDAGAFDGTGWGTYTTLWARVEPAGGRERIAAEALGSQVRYQVTTRYRADLSPAMRLSWTPYGGSAKTLEIHGVHPVDGRRDYVRLLCGEVA